MIKNFCYPLLVFIVACSHSPEEPAEIQPEPENPTNQSAIYYDSLMQRKNIVLSSTGDCEDALMDSLHEWNVAYIETMDLDEDAVSVDFKFKEACCQVFGGDYILSGDTLFFRYEPINEEVCSCVCWYRYNLSISKLPVHVKTVVIRSVERG